MTNSEWLIADDNYFLIRANKKVAVNGVTKVGRATPTIPWK